MKLGNKLCLFLYQDSHLWNLDKEPKIRYLGAELAHISEALNIHLKIQPMVHNLALSTKLLKVHIQEIICVWLY